MVGMGRGCQTCKTRKVKCDATEPTCQRCAKSKQICIPISNKKRSTFSFLDENNYANSTVKRPRGPRTNFVKQQPQIDIETKATAYYMQYHLQVFHDAPIALGGLSECILAWKASSWTDPMVELALLSIALAVYGSTQNDATAMTEASSKYYLLLQTVQDRIAKVELLSLTEQHIDACLLTIFLMGRYEGVAYRIGEVAPNDSFKLFQSWSHHEGALAILKVWRDKLAHQPASEIVKQTRRGQIRSAILRSRILPEWILDGAVFGEQGTELDYDRLLIRVVMLRQSLACAQQRQDIHDLDVERLDHEATSIQNDFEEWFLPLSRMSPQHKHTLSTPRQPESHFHGPDVRSYLNLSHAGMWLQYLATKLLLLSSYCRILDLGSPNLLEYYAMRHTRYEYRMRLQAAAADLAASVPFCLEKVHVTTDGHADTVTAISLVAESEDINPSMTGLLVWPLTIASSIAEIDEDKRTWFRAELASMGKITGDTMLQSATTEEWSFVI